MSLSRRMFSLSFGLAIAYAAPDTFAARLHAPMAFEGNRGQAPHGVDFAARGNGYRLHLAGDSARLFLDDGPRSSTLEMTVVGARQLSLTADKPLPGRSNYLLGTQRSQWKTGIPQFAGAWAREIYPGIDLHYYGQQRNLEYDFVLAPQSDPAAIRLRFRGQKSVRSAPNGDLIFDFGGKQLRKRRPVAYAEPGHVPVDAAYRILADGSIGFSLGRYDRQRTVVIDPVIDFSSYLGGTGTEIGSAIALDVSGNIYVAGTTGSGNEDGFIMKFNPSGTEVLYSVHLGGSGSDRINGIAVDAAGSVYVTGETLSSDFPTSSALTSACKSDAFVAKLGPDGNSVTYSLCLGGDGSDLGRGIAVDAAGNAYVIGDTSGGLATVNAAQPVLKGESDAFIGRLNTEGSAWTYLTYLGGAGSDSGRGIGVDAAGYACIAGDTGSSDFQLVSPLQSAKTGLTAAFAGKFDPAGALLYSTYLGGSGSASAAGAAIDSLGNCFVTGRTDSTDFPLRNAAQETPSGSGDAFVTAYNSSGTAYLYSTYLGGALDDQGKGIAVTPGGIAHVTGHTASGDFPSVAPVQAQMGDYASVYRSADAGAVFSRTPFPVGDVLALAAHPADGQLLYAATRTGIFKSTDAGGSWLRVDANQPGTVYTSLAVDPANACHVLAGENAPGAGSRVMESADCGATWAKMATAPSGREVTSIVFSGTRKSVPYFGFARTSERLGSVGRLSARGAELSDAPVPLTVMAADPSDPCAVYAADVAGRVYRSGSCTDLNWTQSGAALSAGIQTLAADPSATGALLAGTGSGAIYRQVAAGAWEKVAELGGAVHAIAFQPGDAKTVYAAGYLQSIFKSTDGGLTWSPAGTVSGGVSQLAISAASPNLIYAGTYSSADAFYTRLSASGVILDSTPIGGMGADFGLAIALDPAGNAALTGDTVSTAFPVTERAPAAANAGGRDGFVVKLFSRTAKAASGEKSAGGCGETLDAYTVSPSQAGGSFTSIVTAPPGCIWTATSNSSWISIVGAANGNGSGTLNFNVGANSTGVQRVGSLFIGNNGLFVIQDGAGCSYQLSATAATAPLNGGAGTPITVTTAASCPWTAVSNDSWITITSGASGDTSGTVNYTVAASSSSGQRVGTMTIAGQTFTVTQDGSTPGLFAPSIVAASPVNPTGSPQTFNLTVRDQNGSNDISRVYFLVNTTATAAAGVCHGFYDRALNSFYLYNNDLSALLGPLAPGGIGVLQNSQCTLNGNSSVVLSNFGTDIVLNIGLSLQSGFGASAQKVYAWVVDSANLGTGWIKIADWSGASGQGPSVVSGTPSTPSGSPQTFTFTLRDPNGANDISRVYFLVNNTATVPAGSCHGFYDRALNSFYLYNDSISQLLGPLAPASFNILNNSQCILNGSVSYVVSSTGTDLVINFGLTLQGSFAASTQNVYVWAVDSTSLGTGWVQTSTWTGGGSQAPVIVSGTPSTPNGSPQTFTFTARDANGAGDISRLYFLVNTTPNVPAGVCHGFYDRALNAVYLYDNAIANLLGPLAPGSGGSLQNSQCSIQGGTTSVATNGTDLVLNIGMSLLGSFATTSQNVYVWAVDSAALGTGWVQTSTWAGVTTQPPTIVSGLPANPSGSPQTFTFTVRDPNGASDVSRLYFLVNNAPNVPAGSCHGFYDRALNSVYLYNDALSVLQGPLAPGSNAVLQNSQCIIYGGTTAVLGTNGTDIVLNIGIGLQGAFAAASQNVYVWAVDSAALGTGWIKTSTWGATSSNQAPVVVSGAPATASVSPQTFNFTLRDPNGVADLSRMYFLVNTAPNVPAGVCHGFFDRALNAFYLYNDALTVLQGPLAPGSAGTLSNSQCTVNGTTSTIVSSSGTDLVLNLGLSLQGTFAATPKKVYVWAVDAAALGTGWVETSTWTIGAGQPPTVVSSVPAVADGAIQTFTFTINDPDGASDIARVYFLVNTAVTSPPSNCHGFYDRALNRVYLYNDSLTVLQGPMAPGDVAVLQNSQCTIYGNSTSVVSSAGNNFVFSLGVGKTGASASTTQKVFIWAVDNATLGTGWIQISTWAP